MSLMDSLGMNEVELPGELADGKYSGEIRRSEYVVIKKNNGLAHVITYRVDEGDKKGAEIQEWFRLGVNPEFDDNGEPTKVENTMTTQNKEWYKKRYADLGFDINQAKPADLVDLKVYFGVKRKDGFTNVNFVELREQTSQATGDTDGATTGLL